MSNIMCHKSDYLPITDGADFSDEIIFHIIHNFHYMLV